MNEDEARKLATRIIDTWPNGPRAYIWREILLPLQAHEANVTYRQLTTNATSAPTPGTFLIAYRQTRARLTAPPALFEADDELLGRDEYLRRHPPTPNELTHWTRTALKEQP